MFNEEIVVGRRVAIRKVDAENRYRCWRWSLRRLVDLVSLTSCDTAFHLHLLYHHLPLLRKSRIYR